MMSSRSLSVIESPVAVVTSFKSSSRSLLSLSSLLYPKAMADSSSTVKLGSPVIVLKFVT